MDPSSAPLADYFWIAGVDSSSYGPRLSFVANGADRELNGVSLPLESTIDENTALETGARQVDIPQQNGQTGIPGDQYEDSRRFSRLSNGNRLSVGTITAENFQVQSNRSSATIRAVQPNGAGLNDQDFDMALRKFMSERDSFLDELSFSAGTSVPNRSTIYSKALKLVSEDPNVTRSTSGSVRRHFSIRDLNSMKRQPSTARACKL